MSNRFDLVFERLCEGHPLNEPEATDLFSAIFSGTLSPAKIAAIIVALKVRGETIAEITAGAKYLRNNVKYFEQPYEVIDTCGTGGDGAHTYNISTTVAFVLAGAGAKVVKHGGRASSSKSGSSDVLTALGINIDADHETCRLALEKAGLCFLYAPNHHAVMGHVAPVRKDLKIRTIFNLLGPLSNPALAKRQILGVYDLKWLVPLAEVLAQLGVKKAWTVHGLDGLDEISLNQETRVCALSDGKTEEFTLNPKSLGFKPCAPDALKGGDADYNARAMRNLFTGQHNAYRDIVVLNAAAGLLVADLAPDFAHAIIKAQDSIDSGAAKYVLDTLISVTNQRIND